MYMYMYKDQHTCIHVHVHACLRINMYMYMCTYSWKTNNEQKMQSCWKNSQMYSAASHHEIRVNKHISIHVHVCTCVHA